MKADSHFTFSTECGKMILRRGDLSPLFLLERLYNSAMDKINVAVAATASIIRLMRRSCFFLFFFPIRLPPFLLII